MMFSRLVYSNNLLAFLCIIPSTNLVLLSFSLLYISMMCGEGSPPNMRVKHDKEDNEGELLQYLQGINVGIQQAFELVTTIQQHAHIDIHRSSSFIFRYLPLPSFSPSCFALSLLRTIQCNTVSLTLMV